MKTMDQVKRRIITSMIAILLLIITLFGITYAYFSAKIIGNTSDKSVGLTAGKLELTYYDGNGFIEALKIVPDTVIEEKTFSVENTGTHKVDSYEVIVENVTNDLVNYEDLTYVLTCESDDDIECNGSSGVFPQTTDVLVTNSIESGTTHEYTLTLTYNETNKDQSKDMNKTIKAKVNIQDDEQSIKNILIYGNSIQDGMPSPTNPITIQSVGDKTVNLINLLGEQTEITGNPTTLVDLDTSKVYLSYAGSGYFTSGRTKNLEITKSEIRFSSTHAWYGVGIPVKVDPNKTYTFSWDTDSTNARANVTYYSKGLVLDLVSMLSTTKTAKITTPSDCDMVVISIVPSIKDEIIWAKNIQFEESSKLSTYEPYGYKIPIIATGKNLFNINDDFSDVKEYYSGNGYYGHKYNLKPNTEYTVSLSKNNRTEYISLTVDSWYNNNPSKTYWLSHKTNEDASLMSGEKITFTTGDSGEIWINTTNGGGEEHFKNRMLECFVNLQIEEGTTASSYETYIEPTNTTIYLNEPLRKVGECDTCADYIDLYNKKIYRNIGAKTLDGNETYSFAESSAAYNGELSTNRILKLADGTLLNTIGNSKIALNSHLPFYSYIWKNDGQIGYTTNVDNQYHMRFLNSTLGIETSDDYSARTQKFIEYISSQMSLGTPIEIQYQLANTSDPVNIKVDLPNINKDRIVTIDTEIQPSKIEIK